MAGKGGVGKTTTAATIATAASRYGLSVLVVEVAGRSAVASMFGAGPQSYAETILVPGCNVVGSEDDGITATAAVANSAEDSSRHGPVLGRSITPDLALIEWMSRNGFERIVKRMAGSGILEVIATATPGIKDLLVLGRIKALELDHDADLIVVDAPAAGHALGFLRSPTGVRDTTRTGVLHRQADEVLELIGDPARCRVMLVTIPEETPTNELIETAFAIEDEMGVALAPVVVNCVLPELDGLDKSLKWVEATTAEIFDMQTAATLRLGRQRLQADQLARLAEQLPLPQICLPHLFTPQIRSEELCGLAGVFEDQVRKLKP